LHHQADSGKILFHAVETDAGNYFYSGWTLHNGTRGHDQKISTNENYSRVNADTVFTKHTNSKNNKKNNNKLN